MQPPSASPLMNAVRLSDAVLCTECETITDSAAGVCLACGCTSLLELAKILGGTLERQRRAVLLQSISTGSQTRTGPAEKRAA